MTRIAPFRFLAIPGALSAAFCAVALLSTPLDAQQAALKETLEVRLIEIDAVVTDRKGNPITGLGPEDFEVLENGRPQAISNFTEYRHGHEITSGEAGADGGAAAIPPQPRSLVLLIDALPIRGTERRTLFSDLRALVERTMREGDRAQVLTWHDRYGMRVLTPATLSRAEVLEAVTVAEQTLIAVPESTALEEDEVRYFRQLASEPDPTGGPRFDGEAHSQATVRQVATRELSIMRRKTAAFQRLVAAAVEPEHRTVLIYVSGSFPVLAGQKAFSRMPTMISQVEEEEYNTTSMLEAITRTANANGVIVYALRPQLSSEANTLRSMSSLMVHDMNDPMQQLVTGEVDQRYRTFPGGPSAPRQTDLGSDIITLQTDLQALNMITGPTGGTVAVGPAGIKEAAERIARDLDSYYTLAYRAASDGSDRERRVEVRSKSRNHVVRTRSSILDRSDASRARDLLIAKLFEKGEAGDIEFDIQAGAGRPAASNQVLIPVELTIPVEQLRFDEVGEEIVARFSVLAVAGANIGQVSRVKDDSRKIALAKGSRPAGVIRYQLELLATPEPTEVSIAVFDENSGLAGTQSITLEGGEARGETLLSGAAVDATWQQALARANDERRPIVVYFRPARCSACGKFERETLPHPAIQRLLSEVVFVSLPPAAGEVSKLWSSRDAGLAVFDRVGNFRLLMDKVPDTATFGVVLNDVIEVAPHFERAVAAIERGMADDGELDAALAYVTLGRNADARAALARAIENGQPETQQYGRILRALLDAREGENERALEELARVVDHALTPHIAGEAWLTTGLIHRWANAQEEAVLALARARELLDRDSRIAGTSEQARSALASALGGTGTIRVIPPENQIVTGKTQIKTTVASAEVAAVSFALDGVEVARVRRPPFSTTVDFGDVPEHRLLRVTAYDGLGKEIGRHQVALNEGGERFWFRLLDPREGIAAGETTVKMALRAPTNQTVQRVVVSWNDVTRAVVSRPPWETTIDIPSGELGILRGVALLSDGRVAEDAVLLNARGQVERADVQLVELPITLGGAASRVRLGTNEIFVREGGKVRAIDSIQTSSEAPLTLGLLIDTSGSMQKILPDVQEAAIRFLDTILSDHDRAFIVAFDTRAKLVQTPTSDKALLRQQIMSLRARGHTALYDAIAVGLLQLEGVKGRRALVLFSDGEDRTSRYGSTEAADLAKRSHVPIHIIAAEPERAPHERVRGPGGRAPTWTMTYQGLSRMASSTGGSAQKLGRLEELPEIYRRIEEALRSQFLVYVRTEPGRNENDWRPIRVDIAARGVEVHAPSGYYAPW